MKAANTSKKKGPFTGGGKALFFTATGEAIEGTGWKIAPLAYKLKRPW